MTHAEKHRQAEKLLKDVERTRRMHENKRRHYSVVKEQTFWSYFDQHHSHLTTAMLACQ